MGLPAGRLIDKSHRATTTGKVRSSTRNESRDVVKVLLGHDNWPLARSELWFRLITVTYPTFSGP